MEQNARLHVLKCLGSNLLERNVPKDLLCKFCNREGCRLDHKFSCLLKEHRLHSEVAVMLKDGLLHVFNSDLFLALFKHLAHYCSDLGSNVDFFGESNIAIFIHCDPIRYQSLKLGQAELVTEVFNLDKLFLS